MRKFEFLEELKHRLSKLSDCEIEKTASFYAECIDDRIEEGMTEEEAVCALGSIDSIVKEILMDTHTEGFKLLTRIQDEVHRFAIGYHRKVRKKHTLQTELTRIHGIGVTRAKAILSYFKTIKSVKTAEIEKLELVPGMTKPAAQAVYQYFREQEK